VDQNSEDVTKLYGNFIVKHLDYFANPSIIMKNKKLADNFVNNYLPKLDAGYGSENSVFNQVIKGVK